MERHVTMEEISDGRRYGRNDLVKADCHDCQGCSACCRGMGNTIQLDPYDVVRMTQGLGVRFEQMLDDQIELQMADGLILPNIRMAGPEDACSFLNKEGRCSIHPFRPGICRLFPLGRVYEDGAFQYFLQTGECQKTNRTKIKVSKWIDTPDAHLYDPYIAAWHYFIKGLQDRVRTPGQESHARAASLDVLKTFYLMAYDSREPFYAQFYERLEAAGERWAPGR